ncbi:hypothetical protein F2Q70_00004920 [Brassica cretica]|uniref:NADPH-protochlorophyllide oxidoreductase n=2 Tax=Brassica TaxID=3705 RepID=A0A8S9J0H5_BRACR|nr:hypothetical protein F2Q68_00021654 [Brassica cretica]KAF2575574.1 hypothetical protein F2Q70_00004920 [Brassica cretica]
MALQAASLVSSVRKDGKSNASSSLKESSLFGASLSDQIKADLVSFSLRCKREQRLRTTGAKIRAQTIVTSTPSVTRSTFDRKKTLRKGNVVVTGASSGLRDFLKAERAAKSAGMPKDSYTVMHFGLSIVGQREARWDEPFRALRLLIDDLKNSDYPSKRLIIVGSITGNTNTLAGNVLPKANLGDLRGLASGLNGRNNSAMIDGGDFNGAKAYKDSKVCNMLTMQEFHRRFHEETGITFASLYPGCIATTGLFREHITLFRSLFPLFQKYITKGYVPEAEAGKRLAQVVGDPNLTKSGVYWSWNKTSASFENQLSQEASDVEKARRVWEVSEKLVGLA